MQWKRFQWFLSVAVRQWHAAKPFIPLLSFLSDSHDNVSCIPPPPPIPNTPNTPLVLHDSSSSLSSQSLKLQYCSFLNFSSLLQSTKRQCYRNDLLWAIKAKKPSQWLYKMHSDVRSASHRQCTYLPDFRLSCITQLLHILSPNFASPVYGIYA